MIEFESDCVGCGFPCRKNACPHYETAILTCDYCNHESDTLFYYDTSQICGECLVKQFIEVDPYNYK